MLTAHEISLPAKRLNSLLIDALIFPNDFLFVTFYEQCSVKIHVGFLNFGSVWTYK